MKDDVYASVAKCQPCQRWTITNRA
jgi:hypothetical protein